MLSFIYNRAPFPSTHAVHVAGMSSFPPRPRPRAGMGRRGVTVCVFARHLLAASAECLALCWTGGQLNVQEDAAPRNLNDSSG